MTLSLCMTYATQQQQQIVPTLKEDGMALKLLGLPLTYTTDLQVAQLIDYFSQNGQPPGWDKDDFIEFLQQWNADVGPVIRICDLTQDVTESQAFFELLNPQTQQTGSLMVESDVESKALMKLFLEIPPDAAKITGEPDIKFLKMLAGKLEEVRATRVGAFDRSDNAVLIFEIQERVIELLLRCKQNDASAIATTTHLKKNLSFLQGLL